MQRGGTTDYYDQDGLVSVTSLTATNGSIVQNYTYDSFGNTTASTGSLRNYFQYTGREFDTETGLYYYRARYYDPSSGRFLSEDPVRFRAGMSFYQYTRNRPTIMRDPSGKLAIGIIVGGVVGGVEGGLGAYLQGGSTTDIIVSTVVGAGFGAALGAIDPTEGVATVAEIGSLGAEAGIAGDLFGQLFANRGRRCKTLNIGETIFAGIGGWAGGIAGALPAVVASSELGQALLGSAASAIPSTLGAPFGQSLGLTVQSCDPNGPCK